MSVDAEFLRWTEKLTFFVDVPRQHAPIRPTGNDHAFVIAHGVDRAPMPAVVRTELRYRLAHANRPQTQNPMPVPAHHELLPRRTMHPPRHRVHAIRRPFRRLQTFCLPRHRRRLGRRRESPNWKPFAVLPHENPPHVVPSHQLSARQHPEAPQRNGIDAIFEFHRHDARARVSRRRVAALAGARHARPILRRHHRRHRARVRARLRRQRPRRGAPTTQSAVIARAEQAFVDDSERANRARLFVERERPGRL